MTTRAFAVSLAPRGTALLAARLAVLTLASSAWAECGWVLWVMNKSGFAAPVEGFKTKEECVPAARGWDKVQPRCLPDSVDPRAK
jgi:hypothetical protein